MNLKLNCTAFLLMSCMGSAGCIVKGAAAAQAQDTNVTDQVTEETAESIKQTIDSLRLIKIKIDGGEGEIPPSVKPLLTILKHQLRDLIYTRLSSEPIPPNPNQLRNGVLADLRDLGVTVPEPDETVVDDDYLRSDYTYGDVYGVDIESVRDQPDLLVVTTTLGVCCGTDTSLYVFQHDGVRWELVLAQESNDYDDVSGAQGRFQYRVSSPDRHNNFFVVAANVNPWCTSNWQMLRFKILRPGQTAYEPRILLSEEKTIYLGSGFEDEKAYRLKLHGNRFSLEFFGERFEKWVSSLEGDPEELDVLSYKIVGDRVKVSTGTVAEDGQ